MKVRVTFCIVSLFLILSGDLNAQQARIVFYNVENLFDTKDDSLCQDEEFLPGGDKHWTYERMKRKIVKIYQTMVALGEGDMPAVIGLCEIENREALNLLVHGTPLNRLNYRIIQRDSRDTRGIDVAMLFRPDLFTPDSAEWLTVPLSPGETTREILSVTGKMWQSINVHFYINHWPSRYGGAGGSNAKRIAAASTLAASVKQDVLQNPFANIIVMGDFNDEPGDESMQVINKILDHDSLSKLSMVNLSARTSFTDIDGTIKHQGTWSIFDQILVTESVIEGTNGCMLISEKAEVFRPGFLLEPDMTYSGVRPFRTYIGPGYQDGFSDHLPVSILIEKRECCR
jgi:predicted extracellular nuclease